MEFVNRIFMVCTKDTSWFRDNILTIVSIALAMTGGLFAWWQWRNSNKIKRAELIKQIIEKLRFDKEMLTAMYTIDYDDPWYGEGFHHTTSDVEATIDKFLSYLTYICYIKEVGHITKKEFRILGYQLKRTCSSRQVQAYLWNLYHFSALNQIESTFQYLIEYGFRNKIIDEEEFKNEESEKYGPKYL